MKAVAHAASNTSCAALLCCPICFAFLAAFLCQCKNESEVMRGKKRHNTYNSKEDGRVRACTGLHSGSFLNLSTKNCFHPKNNFSTSVTVFQERVVVGCGCPCPCRCRWLQLWFCPPLCWLCLSRCLQHCYLCCHRGRGKVLEAKLLLLWYLAQKILPTLAENVTGGITGPPRDAQQQRPQGTRTQFAQSLSRPQVLFP